ncbi:MAG: hypothetical protein ACK42H_18650, partial [Planctomycetota bacterium]
MRQPLHLFSLIYAALVPLCLGLAMAQDPPLIRKLSAKQLPNAIEVPGGLISGGLPESEQAFQELKQLGVKTIISVDGVKPDVQMAQR